MTSKQLKRIFLNGGCLSLDTMRAYQQGKLPRKEAHTVEEHLLACDLCSAALEGLDVKKVTEIDKVSARVQKRLAVYMNTPPKISFFRRFGLHIGFGIILLLGTSVGIWYSQQDKKPADTTISKKTNETIVQQNKPSGITEQVSLTETNTNSAATVPGNSTADPSGTITAATAVPATADNSSQPVSTETKTADLSGAKTTTPPPASTTVAATSDNTRNTAPEPLEVSIAQIYTRDSYDPNYVASSGIASNGQIDRTAKRNTKFAPEDMPTFPGGMEAFDGWIKKNFRPVTVADRSAIKMYSASFSFTVDASSGKVSNISIMRGISREVDAEIIRVLQSMPAWNKGKKRGEIIVTAGLKVY